MTQKYLLQIWFKNIPIEKFPPHAAATQLQCGSLAGAGLRAGWISEGPREAKMAGYMPIRGAKRISEGPKGAKPTGQGARAAPPQAPLS